MNNSSAVVDASFLIKLFSPEPLSNMAQAVRDNWVDSGVVRRAPSLIDYEIVSALNKKRFMGLINDAEAEDALAVAFEEPVEMIDTNDLHLSALRIAQRLGLRSTYDAHYLAAAEQLDCEFWTADERLYNAVRDRFPLIRWVGAP